MKKKFIELFLEENNIRPIKNISDIFTRINIFDNNFIEINDSPIFTNL